MTALRNYGAAIHRMRYELEPVDARTQAALEREDRWQKETHQKYDDWRTRLLELRGHLPPVIDCTGADPKMY